MTATPTPIHHETRMTQISIRLNRTTFILCLALLPLTPAQAGYDPSRPVEISLDAREAPKRLLHTHLKIPVTPGPLTLLYPQWIPGEHGPTGPINELAALELKVHGQTIAWHRDKVDMYTFHCEIPAAATMLDASFDSLGVTPNGGQFGPVSSTPHLAILNWWTVLLYPANHPSDSLTYRARCKLPEAWKFGTALPVESTSENTTNITFKPTSLTTLVDSPIIAGRHFQSLDLAPGGPIKHKLELAADSPQSLEMPPRMLEGYRRLVAETGLLFHSRHYREYHFLLALSDPMNHFGLEHHESSENRLPERSFLDTDLIKTTASLLPHEMVHSWNGKYRRPTGLTTPDYQRPMQGELLWIYEGLTTYLGRILPARAGLWTPEDFRSHLAVVAADAQLQSGRHWRSLTDSSLSAPQLYRAGDSWSFRRRSTDASFYDEGELLWLEVDSLIREQTSGNRSLNDFCSAFHGGPEAHPAVRLYILADIITALDKVAPRDWSKFFADRVDAPTKHAPLAGLEKSGWRLIFTDEPTAMASAIEKTGKWGFNSPTINLTYNLGLKLKEDGTVLDVVPNLPADRAGISPSVKLIAINGRRFSPTAVQDALKASRNSTTPIELIIKDGDFFKTVTINDHTGPRYPRLERDPTRPDLLTKILNPIAPIP
jgi:predicted metalloprotease with PDZ domain